MLPCHTGSLWQEIVSSPFPLLRSVSQKPKLVGEVLLTASGNKRWCECFYYNQSREQVPLTATIGEKRETPPLPQAEKIGSSLANVPERRGYVSPCLTKEPLFQTAVWCSRASIPKDYMELVNDFLNWDFPHHSLNFLTIPTLRTQGPYSAPD